MYICNFFFIIIIVVFCLLVQSSHKNEMLATLTQPLPMTVAVVVVVVVVWHTLSCGSDGGSVLWQHSLMVDLNCFFLADVLAVCRHSRQFTFVRKLCSFIFQILHLNSSLGLKL